MPFYGSLTANIPKVFSLNTSSKIVTVQAIHNEYQLVCVKFILRDGTKLSFGREKKPEKKLDENGVAIENGQEDEEVLFDTEVDFPLYEKVKQIHVYGVNH